ncbi:peptide chain release factor N(5)-glutamine methyltransferase [Tenacibaculum singaporense]|uniref:peptide chain release factor N(5)-glutamine methyltransferase n=1 Tax=Tenacibaculum singaporense TaxID=2358479 RepID=UPI000F667135|nr:peptide chain release factor N(5)-glutamine methyltransferase [Tenacibaculum singaporense]RSC93079.1 peptide chain release factor N(5)-glutamine methyltransferase [Tenacibaculum singaporense]
MQLKQYKSYFSEELKSVFPQTEVDSFFFLLIEEYLDLKRIDLILQPNIEISSHIKELLDKALERLKKEEPIQYILGKTEFYGLPFKVNENTLIPRPETEELVEWILEEINVNDKRNILDIGTGTGCIPISLKKNLPNSNISAIDVSEEALEIAKQNANLNEVEISFINEDILKTKRLNGIFDIIVSNPPYVRELEKVEIKNNVLKNEPHLALFVKDDNPLLFYKKIADLAKSNLAKNGLLFFEINQYLGSETVDMLKSKGFTQIELQKDMFGNDRMIKASL